MSLALLFRYLMLNMFRMLILPSSGACDFFVELFHGLYCSGSMCVGVTLWFGWGGVVSVCRLKHYLLMCWVISWVVLIWFDVCLCYVVVWLWWCGIRMQCFNLHTDITPPQPNHNVTPTHFEPYQYKPWNNSTNKSQAPEEGSINIRNMLSIK